MTVFRFRLERVLRVRRIEESQAKVDWADAVYAVRSAEEQERRAQDEVLAAERDLAHELSGGAVDARRVLLSQEAIDALRRRVVEACLRTSRCRQEAERRRAAWIAARRDHKALQRLRERGAASHRAAAVHREAAEQDERALARSGEPDSSPDDSVAEKASTPDPRPAA